MRVGQTLERLMEIRGLNQAEVAREAGVSQATVSRLLQRAPQRSGAAYLRLCSYIQQQRLELPREPDDVFAAVRRVWDGSDRHAAALTELIESSERLWPGLARAEAGESTARPTSERGLDG